MRAHWSLLLLVFVAVACGGDDYSTQPGPGGGGGGGGGAHTGLLIDAQRPPTMKPFKGVLEKWSVVDPAGGMIFSSDQVDLNQAPMGNIGLGWRIEEVQGINGRGWLGTNPYTVKVDRDEFNEAFTEGRFYVTDATAAALRGIGNLSALVQKGRIFMLIGKMGE